MTFTPTNLTRSDISTVMDRLTLERNHSLDLVVPNDFMRFDRHSHHLHVDLPEPLISDFGVINNLTIDPSDLMIGQMADKLEIPIKYLRTLFNDARDARYGDHTSAAEALAHGVEWSLDKHTNNSYLIRTFISDDDISYGRAMLSDRYDLSIDALDYLLTMLDGLRDAAPNAQISSIDLTEKTMRIRVEDPSVAALAPALLEGYRSPFNRGDSDLPIIFAGFEAGTSDVGHGRRYFVPRLVVQICNNGLTMTKDAFGKTHLGSKMEDGIIRWSDQTQKHELKLIKSQIHDAVTTYMDIEYVESKIHELTALANKHVAAPNAAIVGIGKELRFTDTEVDGILAHFINGGQATSGGVMQAITSYAQTIDDGDRQSELEHVAVQAMSLV